MQNGNLEVNNLTKDNCIEPTLSLSLGAETSIFRGRSSGKVMVLAQHRHCGARMVVVPTAPSAGAPGASSPVPQCSFDPLLLPAFWELLKWIF